MSVCHGLGIGFFVVSAVFGLAIFPLGIVLTLLRVSRLGIVLFPSMLCLKLFALALCLALSGSSRLSTNL